MSNMGQSAAVGVMFGVIGGMIAFALTFACFIMAVDKIRAARRRRVAAQNIEMAPM